ncbi:MAG TPA: universal stress protein [Acidimicrobiia bacterium]|nr:universal stress protein [Acidimicrobiia bacterium]
MFPRTYVVPLDGSSFAERALPVAAAIAARVDGGLALVTASLRGPLEPRPYLAEVAARYPNLPVETHVHVDLLPADAILEVVGESDDRVVCMTSHGRGRLRWSMLGSTAEEVVRRSDRPVVLVGRHCGDDFLTAGSHLLACADGSEASERIAPVAQEWAEQLQLPLDAAMVVHPRDVESAEHPEPILDGMTARFGGPDRVHAHVLTSSYAAGELADFAGELPAGLIAMSCHARSGLVRVALGSVTMAVLQLAQSPVLVVRCGA